MARRIMAILLLLLFLFGLFLMAYGFIFSKENSTLGIVGIGFVLPSSYLAYLLRRQLEVDADRERQEKEGQEPHYNPDPYADEDAEKEKEDDN